MKCKFFFLTIGLLLCGCVRSVPTAYHVAPTIAGTGSSFPGIPTSTSPFLATPGESETRTATGISPAPQVLEVGYMDEDLLIVTVQMPAVIAEDYEALVEGENYECTQQEQFPDHLYCFGKKPARVVNTSFQLFKKINHEWIVDLLIEIPEDQ
jgi:hypothetical protein